MFTGIIEATARVMRNEGNAIVVRRPPSFGDISVGSSVAVAGVCLTVSALDDRSMTFDLMPETLRVTTLKDLHVDDLVNLERAMKMGDRFDGHVVQGHVEGVAKVIAPSPPHPPSPEGGGGRDGLFQKKRLGSNLLFFARSMRKKSTNAEEVLWEALRRHQVDGLLFRRQHPVGGRILDFYCHKVHLGIELDGPIHSLLANKKADLERDHDLTNESKLHILRFRNEEVLKDLPAILEKIRIEIQRLTPPPSGEGWRAVRAGEREGERVLSLQLRKNMLSNILPKGSIAIDGVSLTVASVEGDRLTIALIPHTLEHTTLGNLKDGDRVNVETDIMTRTRTHAH